MNRRLLLTLTFGVLSILVFYLVMHRDRGRPLDETQTVYIKTVDHKSQLYRNGKPFYIKGASGTSYLKELYEAGGNTLRVYDTVNLKSLLDEAAKYDLAIIVDIPLPPNKANSNYYSDAENVKKVKKQIKKFIHNYKDHSSLLIWNLGNELNYHLSIKENAFVNVFNELVDLVHEEDPNHPVSTSISGTSRAQTLGIHLNAPKLDLIGFNAFGNIPEVEPLMSKIAIICNPKPYYIMEWGNHGPWEAPINLWKSRIEPNSTDKGAIYKNIYNSKIKTNDECLGSLAFYWGYKHEGTPTWFNIFDEEGRKSEVYYILKSIWKEEDITSQEIPKIEKMQLLSSESKDQIVDSNSIIVAQLDMQFSIDETYNFQWEIYKEAWGHQKWILENYSTQAAQSTSKFSNSIKFEAPKDEGPYRVIVYVNDANGNFATANMPFYVLSTQQ